MDYFTRFQVIPAQNHFSDSLFRPLSRSFIVAFGVHSMVVNSLADYIIKLLVGQGCLLRLCGRVDASLVTLF